MIKKKVLIWTVMSLSLAGFICLFALYGVVGMGDIKETWETSNRTFKLQIERRAEENGGFLPGSYYVYKSASENSNDWKTIFIERHDDPNPISTDSVRFIDSKTAYVFFGSKYAVTLDAGENWSVWDAWEADKVAHFKNQGLYPSINDVRLDPSGSGEIQLYSIKRTAEKSRTLKTVDFGVNWELE